MKNLLKLSIFILFIFIVFSTQIYSCSIYQLIIINTKVKSTYLSKTNCIDADCVFSVKNNEIFLNYDNNNKNIGFFSEDKITFTYEGIIEVKNLNLNNLFIDTIDELIISDFSELGESFFNEFNSGKYYFTDYNEKKINEYNSQKNDIFTCSYSNYNIINNWLVVSPKHKEYCSDSSLKDKSCVTGDMTINPIYFLNYIIQNPTSNNLPILLLYFLPIVFIALSIGIVIKILIKNSKRNNNKQI